MESVKYNVGQYVVYSGDGVCEIVGIGKPCEHSLAFSDEYYFLRPLGYEGMIYAPVDVKDHLRPIIPKQAAVSLMNSLSSLDVRVVLSRDKKQLAAHYDALLANGDCVSYAKTIKSILKKRTGAPDARKSLSIMEEQLLKRTEHSLLTELSVSLGLPVETVREKVESALMN